MGLFQIPKTRPRQRFSQFRFWLPPATVILVAFVFAGFGDPARDVLSYDRPALVAGEWWRLVTGHFVHLGWMHLALNGAGLILVWLLVGYRYPAPRWSAVFLIILLGMDAAFWFLNPALVNYVGLSGVLHGLLVAGLVPELAEKRWDSWLLLCGIVWQLGYEQAVSISPNV